MFENTLLASSILCLVCAVIIAIAGIIWARMAIGGKKKTDNKNIKERANAAVAADKAEESKAEEPKAEEPVVTEESEDVAEYHNYNAEDETDAETAEPETEDETDAKKEFEKPSIEEVEPTEAEADAEETSETEEVEKTETEE